MALPFYVLHETVIVVAYFVLSWPVAAGVQYGVIALTSLAEASVAGVPTAPTSQLRSSLAPAGRCEP